MSWEDFGLEPQEINDIVCYPVSFFKHIIYALTSGGGSRTYFDYIYGDDKRGSTSLVLLLCVNKSKAAMDNDLERLTQYYSYQSKKYLYENGIKNILEHYSVGHIDTVFNVEAYCDEAIRTTCQADSDVPEIVERLVKKELKDYICHNIDSVVKISIDLISEQNLNAASQLLHDFSFCDSKVNNYYNIISSKIIRYNESISDIYNRIKDEPIDIEIIRNMVLEEYELHLKMVKADNPFEYLKKINSESYLNMFTVLLFQDESESNLWVNAYILVNQYKAPFSHLDKSLYTYTSLAIEAIKNGDKTKIDNIRKKLIDVIKDS